MGDVNIFDAGAVRSRPGRGRFGTAAARLRVIEPILKFQAAQLLGKQPLVLPLSGGEPITKVEPLVEERAWQFGLSARTVWRWLAAFRERGLAGLQDAPRSDFGTLRAFRGRGLALAVAFGLFSEGQTARAIHGALVELWPSLYPGSKPPSYPSVRQLLRSLGDGSHSEAQP